MDPISALGVASAVVTFVDFSRNLVSTIYKTYKSVNEADNDTVDVEATYAVLNDLSLRLVSPPDTSYQQHDTAITKLAEQCRVDCGRLLQIFSHLRVDGERNRLWRSLRSSLKAVVEGSTIKGIQDRLDKAQLILSFHVGTLVSNQLLQLSEDVAEFKKDNDKLRLNQVARLDEITVEIKLLRIENTRRPERRSEAIPNRAAPSTETPQQIGTAHALPKTSTAQLQDQLERLARLHGIREDLSKEQAILASLDFETRRMRYEGIPQAYEKTFEWIIQPRAGFSEWLRRENGTFWVSGKAGSGKSTLMKFIANHPQTQEMLLEWSGSQHLTIATHYFWAAGASLQKSPTGLFRTLLYDIFRECPELIRELCPTRWAPDGRHTYELDHSELSGSTSSQRTWTHAEFMEIFKILSGRTNLSTKFCFFIDGMDEYRLGNTQNQNAGLLDLCEMLEQFASSSHIKLCLSSRPWNVFNDSFGRNPARMFQVQDFTGPDILNFTRARLAGWGPANRKDERLGKMIKTISERAQGVFLWVFLVTRSLREGLTNGDNMNELADRLNSLPADLERLFQYMLDQVDHCYARSMAGMFLIALHATEPLRLDIYSYYDKEYEDGEGAVFCPVAERDEIELRDLYEQTQRRLNTRSSGLLEYKKATHKVDFLHRTVSDFLRTNEMKEYLEAKCEPDFDPNLSIATAHVMYMKSTRFSDIVLYFQPPIKSFGQVLNELTTCLEYASLSRETSADKMFSLLDEMEYAMEDMFGQGLARFRAGSADFAPKIIFREELLRSNAATYITRKLQDLPAYLSGLEASPISYTILAQPVPIETLRVLLRLGEDPNRVTKLPGGLEMSPWVYLCFVSCHRDYAKFSSYGREEPEFNDFLDQGFFKLFLSHGADPNDVIPDSKFTAFAMYLTNIFGPAGHVRRFDEYLETLNRFLREGADLNARLSFHKHLQRNSKHGIQWLPEPGKESTILEAFFHGLKSLGLRRSSGLKSGKFVTEVVRTLLAHKMGLGQDIEAFISGLPSIFGEHAAASLVKQLQSPDTLQ